MDYPETSAHRFCAGFGITVNSQLIRKKTHLLLGSTKWSNGSSCTKLYSSSVCFVSSSAENLCITQIPFFYVTFYGKKNARFTCNSHCTVQRFTLIKTLPDCLKQKIKTINLNLKTAGEQLTTVDDISKS